jgi:hypothetical protein
VTDWCIDLTAEHAAAAASASQRWIVLGGAETTVSFNPRKGAALPAENNGLYCLVLMHCTPAGVDCDAAY